MRRSSTVTGPAALALLAVLSVAPPASHAATRSSFTFAVDNCNGALPGFEGAFRKRPLAIANEGTANAFLSCAVPNDETLNEGTTLGAVYVTNRASSAQAISCTMVDGLTAELSVRVGFAPPVYRSKTIGVAPGELGVLTWTPMEYGVPAFTSYISFNCSVPAGVEINVAGTSWTDEAPVP